MIALLDGMPLVALPDGRITSFDKRWITISIRNAAENAGYHRWWLAEHIAESVSVYLHRDFEENSVGIKKLQEAVLEVLQSLGFEDVAGHFRLPDPPVSISLRELVHEAGDNYELAFFGLLGERLSCLADSHSEFIEIRDLSECLRLLEGRRKKTQGLREEIVTFIRKHGEHSGSSRHGAPLQIQLS
jgi:hypothetical protein